jgi:DnaJ-class molecular chaperone
MNSLSTTTIRSSLVSVSRREKCNVCTGRGELEQLTLFGIIDVIKCKACRGTGFIERSVKL